MRRTFGTLDGLRGVAALAVLFFHLAPVWPGLPSFGSAYLSVDLFFMLSGFVIGHAYDDRLAGGMTFGRFLEVRLLRLYPLYILGCAIGLCAPVAVAVVTRQWWVARPAISAVPWALAMLPDPGPDPAGWFRLNPPAWSLFFELVVNILYALFFPRLSERVLAVIAAIAGVALAVQAVMYGTINFDVRGWAMLGGFARPAFSFTLGLLLRRRWQRGALPAPRFPAIGAILMFLVLISVPASGAVAGVLAPAAVILGFPLVMILGIANEPAPKAALAMATAGRLSYAVYALHFPLLTALDAVTHLGWMPLAFAHLIAVPLVVTLAWLATRLFDEPLRAALGRRLAARRSVEAAPAF